MTIDRRHWLKQAGLLCAGLTLARLPLTAAPAKRIYEPFVPDDSGPIRLSSNENPYGPAPLARKAMADAVGISNRYQWKMIGELVSAIAAKNGVTDENVLVGAGSTQIIDLVLQLAAAQKGSFIVADPTFSRWSGAAGALGLQKIAVPLTSGKRHDLPAMLRAIRPDTRLVYICNPNNPTGTVCRHEDLVAFMKEATKRTMVLVDEAYLDYAEEPSFSHEASKNERLIVVKTFSKIYGMAGARIGYALAHPKTIEQLAGIRSGANIDVSAVSMAGALASLKDVDFIGDAYTKNETVRSYTVHQLDLLGIPSIPSYTNFIYFSLGKYKNDLFARLKAHNIEGTELFEQEGKWSRITVGTMAEMQRFIAAIQ